MPVYVAFLISITFLPLFLSFLSLAGHDVVLHRPIYRPLPNPTVITDRVATVITCNGLTGGSLVWTSNNTQFPSNLSLLNNTSAVYVSNTGPNNISLAVNSAAFTSTPINFTCYSNTSSASMIIS